MMRSALSLTLSSRTTFLLALVAAVLLMSNTTAFAAKPGDSQIQPQIRASLATADTPLVGQKLTLEIDLLVPGIFADSPAFDIPHVPGLLILPPNGSPTITSEDRDGVSFIVQRHELLVFARQAGSHEIPAFRVRFSFKPSPLDKNATAAEVTTPAISFVAKMPPGAEGLSGIICARELDVCDSWQPAIASAKVGDAFTRTIEYSAAEIPGMSFPPFPATPIDGLRLYHAAPQVKDEIYRGQLTGQRRDSITYVCERPGHFTIPAAQLSWWNLDKHKLETIAFAEQTFEVASNPALASAAPSPTDAPATSRNRLIGGAAICLVGLLALVALAGNDRIAKPILAYFRPVRLADLNPKGQG